MRSIANKRFISLLCGILILSILFVGCNSQKTSENTGTPEQSNTNETTLDSNTSNNTSQMTLPIVTKPITLTCYRVNALSNLSNFSELKCFQEIEKKTGIKIEWIHPTGTSSEQREQFAAMLATQDVPDLIYIDWSSQNVPQLVSDGTIIKLNDYIDKYAPNYKKALDDHPDWRKQTTLDDGTIYKFAYFLAQPMYNGGFIMRKDWLDALGLKEPTTIDEWYNVLKAFKKLDANGNGDPNDEIPYADIHGTRLPNFTTAWGIGSRFYQYNGQVRFGPIQPEYKEFLATMQKWYQEGLINQGYTTYEPANLDSDVENNIAGSWYGALGGNMGNYLDVMKSKYPNVKMVGLPSPKASSDKGFGGPEYEACPKGYGTVITCKNQYIEESVKWLDYMYTDEARLLLAFGIENETYTMKDGKPQYTDLVLKNPEGMTSNEILGKYCIQPTHWSYITRPEAYPQLLKYSEQREAFERWTEEGTKANYPARGLPPITLTVEESQRFSDIMDDINTYVGDMTNKFIMDNEPIENFDNFVKSIKDMGIDEAIAIQQAALERYNKK